LKAFGNRIPGIPARKPQVAPNQPGAWFQLDADALVIAAAPEGNGRSRQNHQHGARLDHHVPLLGGEAVHGGMNTRSGLARHDRAGFRTCPNLDQLAISVQKAGCRIE